MADTEVAKNRCPIGSKKDIGGLTVPMINILSVCGLKCLDDGKEDDGSISNVVSERSRCALLQGAT
jgi:hypothetical protein